MSVETFAPAIIGAVVAAAGCLYAYRIRKHLDEVVARRDSETAVRETGPYTFTADETAGLLRAEVGGVVIAKPVIRADLGTPHR